MVQHALTEEQIETVAPVKDFSCAPGECDAAAADADACCICLTQFAPQDKARLLLPSARPPRSA